MRVGSLSGATGGRTIPGRARLNPTINQRTRLVSVDSRKEDTENAIKPTRRALATDLRNASPAALARRAVRLNDRPVATRMPTKNASPNGPNSAREPRYALWTNSPPSLNRRCAARFTPGVDLRS